MPNRLGPILFWPGSAAWQIAHFLKCSLPASTSPSACAAAVARSATSKPGISGFILINASSVHGGRDPRYYLDKEQIDAGIRARRNRGGAPSHSARRDDRGRRILRRRPDLGGAARRPRGFRLLPRWGRRLYAPLAQRAARRSGCGARRDAASERALCAALGADDAPALRRRL